MQIILRRLFVTLPKIAFVLGGEKITGKLFLYMKLVKAVFVWKITGRQQINFTFTYNKLMFAYTLQDSSDIAALEEIYVDKEYEWTLPFEPQVILDLGANFGDTALYYHTLYPDAVIIALEPSEESYQRLCVHTAAFKNIIPVHSALNKEDGHVDLFIMPESSLGNSVVRRKEGMQPVRVPAVSLSTLQQTYAKGKQFDLIKFDIEGAEDVLLDLGELDFFARAYIGELHFDLMQTSKKSALQKFQIFKTSTQNLSSDDRVIIRAVEK
jgi:FkbM family methyltransferase